MKQLKVQNQVRLSPGRIFGLTVSGISVRMFRSLVTVVILTLAVTFLSHSLVHSLISHEARYYADQELERYRVPSRWATRLTTPDSRAAIRQHLAEQTEPYCTEYQRWTGASEERMAAASNAAARLLEYETYFEQRNEAKALILLQGRTPVDALAALSDPEEKDRLAGNLKRLTVPDPPGGLKAMEQFALNELPELIDLIDQIRAGHRAAIEQVAEARGELIPMRWFAQEDSQIESTLREAGFAVDSQTAELLREAGGIHTAQQTAKAALNVPAMNKKLVRTLDVEVVDLHQDRLMRWLDNRSRAEWMVEQMRQHMAGDADLRIPEPSTLVAAAAQYRRQSRLQDAVGAGDVEARAGLFDLPVNTQWLVTLSFLVCAVGVTNAMFMSVTERFAEIATMKCLGALDGFLMQMFLFESLMQGLVGATAGVVFGLAIAIGRSLAAYGPIAWTPMPWPDIVLGGVLSFVVGLILSVIAGVGPALAVARLAPMEAMRIE